jgi:hypothetical protein
MDFKKIIWILILIGMVACAAVIIGYYWTATNLVDIYSVPIFVLATSLVYIGLQLLKRIVLKIQNWWDWTYYLGLVAIVAPVLLANESNQLYFHLLTDYVTFFLLLPAILDARKIFKK